MLACRAGMYLALVVKHQMRNTEKISIDSKESPVTDSDPGNRYRILMLDDDISSGIYFKAILTKAGLNCLLLSNPENLLGHIVEFNPDLILLDLYMPDYSGKDLVKLIRQMPANLVTPVVFLSSEMDKEKQILSMDSGGDDFLDKSINAANLVALIKTRIKRMRAINKLVTTDSLTGLLNRQEIFSRLEYEMVRAERTATRLSLCMIDIDHFKSVNDSFGHPCGDTVLKSLAAFLKSSLRRSDLVGRYGGEEFLIILPDTNGDNAQSVMDGIRYEYSQNIHRLGDQDTVVTFSGGISTNSGNLSVDGILENADKTLYLAKNTGRNRIYYMEGQLIQPPRPN